MRQDLRLVNNDPKLTRTNDHGLVVLCLVACSHETKMVLLKALVVVECAEGAYSECLAFAALCLHVRI